MSGIHRGGLDADCGHSGRSPVHVTEFDRAALLTCAACGDPPGAEAMKRQAAPRVIDVMAHVRPATTYQTVPMSIQPNGHPGNAGRYGSDT